MSFSGDLRLSFTNGLAEMPDSEVMFNAMYNIYTTATQLWDEDFRASELEIAMEDMSIKHKELMAKKLKVYNEHRFLP